MPNIRPGSRIAVPSGSSDWANQGSTLTIPPNHYRPAARSAVRLWHAFQESGYSRLAACVLKSATGAIDSTRMTYSRDGRLSGHRQVGMPI